MYADAPTNSLTPSRQLPAISIYALLTPNTSQEEGYHQPTMFFLTGVVLIWYALLFAAAAALYLFTTNATQLAYTSSIHFFICVAL